MFRIETIAIGDELLTGRIADTNSAYVAGRLFPRGQRLDRITVVADDESQMRTAFSEAAARAQVVICFGGLGPTSDDKTAAVAARFLNSTLIEDAASLERLHAFLKARGRPETPQVRKQIQLPRGARPLLNSVGLAPGFAFAVGETDFYFLPGVPAEMKVMFSDFVLPELEQRLVAAGAETLFSHTWKCLGIPESELQRRMDATEAALPPQAYLGYRTRFPENHLTLYWRSPVIARSPKGDEATPPEFLQQADAISHLVAEWAYTDEELELEDLILRELKGTGKTVAFAESCTGGLCAQRMTRVPGASENVWGSAVVYQVDAKRVLLGVEAGSPEDAVSADCSRRLAENLKARSGCDIAAAVTGYLGPSGGTDQDPVGTIYICVVGEVMIERRITHPGLNREASGWGASTYVLNEIWNYLKKNGK